RGGAVGSESATASARRPRDPVVGAARAPCVLVCPGSGLERRPASAPPRLVVERVLSHVLVRGNASHGVSGGSPTTRSSSYEAFVACQSKVGRSSAWRQRGAAGDVRVATSSSSRTCT